MSATIPETARGRSWLWLLLLAPVAAVIGAGLVLGILALAMRGDPAPVTPAPIPQQQQPQVPMQFQPQPQPMPQPTWPQQQMPVPAPQPQPQPTGAPGEPGALAVPPEGPAAAPPPSSITIHEPFTVGEVNDAAIHDVLRRARASMDECRATEPVRVRVQFFVDEERGITLAGPDHENPGPAEVARCIASRIRIAVPDGWQPGDGIVKIDVDLPASPQTSR